MDNPYTTAAPVAGRDGFFGRASELNRIASRIAAERPQSVSVLGPRRSGKSSLVNYLLDPAAQVDYLDDPGLYALLRLRLRFHTPADPAAFFARVDQALQFVGEPGIPASHDGFNQAVKRLMGEGRRLILFLDDFGEVTRGSGFPLDFFSFMRSVANSHDVGYLTTSSAPLQSLCHTQDIEESPFFNIFTTVNLEPLSAPDSRRLVAEPAEAAGAPFAQQVEWILELAGQQPYLLQLVAGIAFQAQSRAQELSAEGLAALAFAETREHLESLWADLSEPQRQVLADVEAGRPVERRHEYAVESLERRGYLRRDGDRVEFAASLFRRFAAQRGGKRGFLRRWFR